LGVFALSYPMPAASTTAVTAYGVDVSVAQTQQTFQCFRDPTFKGKSRVVPLVSSPNNGPSYTIAKQKEIAARAFTRLGIRTPLLNGQSPGPTIKAAAAAGYQPSEIGVYFIDFRAKQGASAAAGLIKNVAATLAKAGVTSLIGQLWLDVEGTAGGPMWSTSTKTNCDYITQIVKTVKADPTTFPWKLGLYTGMYTWASIVGTACDFTIFKDLPLWYAAYGSSYDDFSSFKPMKNAWQTAAVHQWHGTTSFCGTVVDFNVYA